MLVTQATILVAMPLLAFVIILSLSYRRPQTSAYVAISCTAISLILSFFVLASVWQGNTADVSITWADLGSRQLELGVLVDPMSAVMFLVVSFISLLVLIYSLGYMREDPGFSLFFAYLSLFVFSMLGLVASNNFLQIFIFWELVGLCSYLLIGFWYDKPGVALPPSSAGMRAFIVTRIGDVGFLIGILFLALAVPTLNFSHIFQAIAGGTIEPELLTVAAVLIFAGAVGKSAQFPLHVWLPDAMEGPTPVSALIHAATMVAAGVYLVARVITIFNAGPDSLLVVAYIGGFTALLAASIGIAITDFKRVIAYSTISQLGYMMMALGVSGVAATGMFHLYTHAFFKALLFLAIGSVIHAVGSQEMKDLGGLGGKMKITSLTFLAGSLALAGIPPFAGFWSKDEIIHAAIEHGYTGLGVLGLLVAFMTAFYIFRVYFATFYGAEPQHMSGRHAHESPPVMTIPLIILAVMSLIAGWIGTPWNNYFAAFLAPGTHEGGGPDNLGYTLMILSSLLALGGILLAWSIYGKRHYDTDPLAARLPSLYRFLTNKWYIEAFYYGVIVRYGGVGLSYLCAWFDRGAIDGLVNGVARVTALCGSGLRRLHTGYLQFYALTLFAGVVIITVYFLLFSGI